MRRDDETGAENSRTKRPTRPPMGRQAKKCGACQEVKPAESFGAHSSRHDGLQPWCRACRGDNGARPGTNRHRVLKGYNLTAEQFDAQLAAQGGRCAICRTDDPGRCWCVDHDHACCPGARRSCGRCVRGVLCSACNIILGLAGDDPERLWAAADYLIRTAIVTGITPDRTS